MEPLLALLDSPTFLAGVGVVVAALVAGGFAVAWLVAAPRERLAARLAGGDDVGPPASFVDAPSLAANEEPGPIARLLRPLAAIARPSTEDAGRLRERLSWAGIRGHHAIEAFLGAKVALGLLLGGGFLIATMFGEPPEHRGALVVVLTSAGFFGPNQWLSGRIKERQRAISMTLADALDLLVVCVEAGLGVEAAIARVVGEIHLSAPVLAKELSHTMLEIRAGVARSEAFRRLATRTGVEELRALAAMLVQTEMFGTSVANALRTQASTMRIQRTQRAEERGATAAARMVIPLVLFILPALLTVIIGPAAIRISRTLMPIMGGN